MYRFLLVLALIGCHHAGPVPHVQADRCKSGRPSGGFDPVFDDTSAQFVVAYEDDPDGQVYNAYAGTEHRLERRRPEQADRTKNLIVYGRFDSNALVRELRGPVTFERGRFTLGTKVYANPGDGIALIMPSPFAPHRFVVAYVGNARSGLDLTQSVPTGEHQFTVVSPELGGIVNEGEFCVDGAWHYHAALAVDRGAPFDAYKATLQKRTTPHHEIYFVPGTRAARDIDAIAGMLENDYAQILSALQVPALEHPIVTYLWSDRAKKQDLTGDGGNGIAVGSIVHALHTDDVSALGQHEYVHVVASERLGAGGALLSEGLAVALDGNWNGRPLLAIARELASRNELPPLDKLLCCFRDIDDNVGYPVAGALVAYMVAHYGMATVEKLYPRTDTAAAITEILGVPPATLEADWHASIRSEK